MGEPFAHLSKKPETMIYHKMTDRDLERLQSLAVEAALIVQDYRPAGTDTIEWMAQCDQYRELAMMGSYCLLELTTRNKEKSNRASEPAQVRSLLYNDAPKLTETHSGSVNSFLVAGRPRPLASLAILSFKE